MYVLTKWHPDYEESTLLAASESLSNLMEWAAADFEEAADENECETDELVWTRLDDKATDLEAYVDWGWGADEVYRISPVKVI